MRSSRWRRRWCTVLASTGLLIGVMTPSAMGAVSVTSSPAGAAEPTEQRTGATFVPSEDAVPGVAPPGAAENAVYLNKAGEVIAAPGSTADPEAARIGCTPNSKPDYTHTIPRATCLVTVRGREGTAPTTLLTCTTVCTSTTPTVVGGRRRVRQLNEFTLAAEAPTARRHVRPATIGT